MHKFLVFLLVIRSLTIFAQPISISATVMDAQNMLLNGNVILLDSNSNFIMGTYFENGNFLFTTEFVGDVQVKVSSLGYENYEVPITLTNDHIKMGNVILKQSAQEIQEVVVTAKKLMFEKTEDGTKINIQNSYLSKSANANELLGRIPTISIAGNKVTVFGRGEALLIMNGKEITFESYKSLPPSDIKSVEIITNPDARYDAKGKAVVMITMQKHYAQGTNISIVNGTTIGMIKNKSFGKYTVNAPNITVNTRKGKWDLSTYYGNELGTNWAENNFITSIGNFKKYGYYTEDNQNTSVHYYRFGIGYKINNKSTLSVQYDGLSHYFNLDVIQNGDYYSSNSIASKIRMTNVATTRLQNHSANVNYFNKFTENGNTLFVGIQYNRFQNKLLDNIIEHIDTISYNRINDNLNIIDLYTAQTDYSHKLIKGSINIGVKFSHTSNEGNIQFFSKLTSESNYSPNNIIANNIIYKEFIPAMYAVYKHTWNKFNANIGIRYEHTIANSKSLLKQIEYFNHSYSNLFPSAKLQYTFNDIWKLNASFANKINLPLYQDMDPFLWYLDSLTSIQGNALLRPEYLNQSEIKLLYKTFAFRYAYTLSNRTITPVMMSNLLSPSPNAVVFTKDNIQERSLHSLAVEAPFEKGNYSCYNSAAVNFYQFKDNREAYKSLQNKPQLYVYSLHAYKISNWFTTELSGEYFSSSFDGFTNRRPYYYFTIALSKSFLKQEALNINLMWNDFARTALWAGKFTANTFSNEYKQRFTVDYLRLTVTYNIHSKTTFNYTNKNVNDAEFNRIKK